MMKTLSRSNRFMNGHRNMNRARIRAQLGLSFARSRTLSLESLESRFVPTAPVLIALSPADNSTNVPVSAHFTMTFDQPIVRGLGTLDIVKSSDQSTVKTIPIESVTIVGNTATFDPGTLADDMDYYVQALPTPIMGVFINSVRESFTGLSSSTDWNFRTVDLTSPSVISLSPTNGAVGVPISSDLVMNFSEPVQKGNPDVAIHILRNNTHELVEEIHISDPRVRINGSTVTIDTRPFQMNTSYFVTIPPVAFTDLAGNNFSGIDATTALSAHEWTFTAVNTASELVVNSFNDFPDVSPGDGIADDGTGHTTLRAAIMEANTLAAPRTIRVPAGIYSLLTTGPYEDNAATGDLDILTRLTIVGDSPASTIIDGVGLDRVFHVLPGADAKLSKLTIRNGSAPTGGGISNQGTLSIDNIALMHNGAGLGGGIYSESTLSIVGTSLTENNAEFGGALYNRLTNITILNSTIGENSATGGGGGLVTINGGGIALTNVTVFANRAPMAGGIAALETNITIKNSIIAGNSAGVNPDIYGSNYTSLGNNLIGNPNEILGFIDGTNGDQVGSNTLPLDPRLGPAGTYGGSTIVYPLLPSSPAIDHGNNADATSVDQLGKARIVDGDDDGTETIDIGAVEFQPINFVVNSFSDLPDVLPGDGIADDGTGHTTLRAAIMEANALQGRVKIRVPAGIYLLASNRQEVDTAASGDLDIAKSLTIIGDGAETTIVDGDHLDRVFHVLPGANAKLSKMTIRNGSGSLGGGVRNEGVITLDNTKFTGNSAYHGGAIYNDGTMSITNASFVNNVAAQFGGGIYSESSLSIVGSSLTENSAELGGALYTRLSNTAILNSTIGANSAARGGGGLVTIDGGEITLTNATVFANQAPTAGGMAEVNARITLKNTIVAGNLAGDNPDLYGSNYASLGNNFIGNFSGVLGLIDGTNGDQVGNSAQPLDPHLGSAGTYGGTTVVYPLLTNSPAIDRGNSANAAATDQLGNPRIVDGDDDGTDVIDIGAVEFQLSNHKPRFTSLSTFAIPENSNYVSITATDIDLPAQVVTFSVTGGADRTLFAITPNGVLTFISMPDYENPTDANRDNLYLVQVTAVTATVELQHKVCNYTYWCFVVHCRTQLLQSYRL